MTVPAQSGVFSFTLQSRQLNDDITFQPDMFDWYRTRAPRIGLGTIQNQEVFPLETGGPIVPTGAYKAGQYGGGDVELIPRAENVLGILLYAALGNVQSYSDQVYDPSSGGKTVGTPDSTGVNTHIFRFNPSTSFFLPWLACRKFVPGATTAENYGEVYQDAMVGNFRLDIRSSGLLGASLSIQNRAVTYPSVSDVNAWTYANSTEDSTSAPLSNNGSLTIGGEEYPITQMTVELANQLTTPQQEMVVGSNHPDSFVPLSRSLTIRIVVKWNNPDLYRQILTGSTIGEVWDTAPFIVDTSGDVEAFNATFYAPNNIGSTSYPYMLAITANRIVAQIDGAGVELQAGNIVQVPYTITVLEPASGDYCRFVLHNEADYTLPDQATLSVDGTVDYSVGGATPTAITAAAAYVSGLSNINGGRLVAEIISGYEDGDTLTIEDVGTVTNTAGEIAVSATAIGDATGGTGGAPLLVDFDAAGADNAGVSDVIEALSFDNSGATVGSTRRIRVTVWDGAGGLVYADTIATMVA